MLHCICAAGCQIRSSFFFVLTKRKKHCRSHLKRTILDRRSSQNGLRWSAISMTGSSCRLFGGGQLSHGTPHAFAKKKPCGSLPCPVAMASLALCKRIAPPRSFFTPSFFFSPPHKDLNLAVKFYICWVPRLRDSLRLWYNAQWKSALIKGFCCKIYFTMETILSLPRSFSLAVGDITMSKYTTHRSILPKLVL